MLYGQEHVERYRETGGEEGHEWRDGVYTLLLTTTGRSSGTPHTTPLIYVRDGDDFVVVASKGGAPEHPDWYVNLQEDPRVEVQIADEVFTATAGTAGEEDRARLWSEVVAVWPDYDDYAAKTDREIPLVLLTPAGA
ncbi:nitroreductase family deazaflavin-dependent oxidoreductase [Salsipaludibacter albus]|uniref:nitroreductase family deazaflavin-dependent oxidoreductase n=1 Tax=Salsipaludibacter albus TaxID=2849650 RepID=UPI001EE4AC56|nr:nitroreductase family deazaflavin-dependent oxidoreductase [Salsipaludibacter albus]MBY5161446.1 nitroreductase family deazaflavin-dependent oxidoreductase [Salsipaludibacter albus]